MLTKKKFITKCLKKRSNISQNSFSNLGYYKKIENKDPILQVRNLFKPFIVTTEVKSLAPIHIIFMYHSVISLAAVVVGLDRTKFLTCQIGIGITEKKKKKRINKICTQNNDLIVINIGAADENMHEYPRNITSRDEDQQ